MAAAFSYSAAPRKARGRCRPRPRWPRPCGHDRPSSSRPPCPPCSCVRWVAPCRRCRHAHLGLRVRQRSVSMPSSRLTSRQTTAAPNRARGAARRKFPPPAATRRAYPARHAPAGDPSIISSACWRRTSGSGLSAAARQTAASGDAPFVVAGLVKDDTVGLVSVFNSAPLLKRMPCSAALQPTVGVARPSAQGTATDSTSQQVSSARSRLRGAMRRYTMRRQRRRADDARHDQCATLSAKRCTGCFFALGLAHDLDDLLEHGRLAQRLGRDDGQPERLRLPPIAGRFTACSRR